MDYKLVQNVTYRHSLHCIADFLENDVGLWDAFFMSTKNSSKYHSVLKPCDTLPMDEYLKGHSKRVGSGKTEIKDLGSLRVLLPNSQKHLAPTTKGSDQETPMRQVICRAKRVSVSYTHLTLPTNREV